MIFHKSNKPILHLIYEDRHQIRKNSFINQLYKTLKQHYDIVGVSSATLKRMRGKRPGPGERILCLLKLRSWVPMLPYLAPFCEKGEVFFYDQDPWEAYHDSGACLGAYKAVAEKVAVRKFLVTSDWWRKHIAEQDGVPTGFVRMGALPENCSLGSAFEERPYLLGFQGTVHAHRRAFYDRLAAKGYQTEILPYKPFGTFLKTVQDIGIFVYNDDKAIVLNGQHMPIHGLWGKCLTVAARGCFVIRNDDLTRAAYGIEELPSVYAFANEDEIPSFIDEIQSLSPSEREDHRRQTVNRIQERNDWKSVVTAIESSVS